MPGFADVMANAFEDELKKIAEAKVVKVANKGSLAKFLIPAAIGAAGYETIRRANQDRRMGRAMRVQQGAY